LKDLVAKLRQKSNVKSPKNSTNNTGTINKISEFTLNDQNNIKNNDINFKPENKIIPDN
jgi:hypothetical protein